MKKLMVRAALGFCFLFAAMAAFLFLSAGTIRYPLGWLYLLVFFVPVFFITAYLYKNDPKLLERRVEAGPGAEKEKSQNIIQSLASVFFASLFVVSGLDFRFHWSVVPMDLSLLADGFVVLGLYAVFLVFKENSFTSATIEVSKEQKVISTGPYRLVRHPMYSGAIFMMLFTPVGLGSYWAIFCVLPLLVSIIVRLLDEEKFLIRNLPGYPDYLKKVRYRLIPFIW
jgi:protein-S-isoprenylcysteine O-methyltransferase Ste14